MNGLLQQQAPQQAPKGPNKNGQAYQKLSQQLGEFLYSDQGVALISKTFRSTGDVSAAIPVIVSRIFQHMIEGAGGKTMPSDMVAMAMVEITAAVIEMAVAAGLMTEGDADAAGPEMFMESARSLDKNMGEKMNPEQRQGLGQVFTQIMQGGQR